MITICIYVGESCRIGRWYLHTHAWNGWIMSPAATPQRLMAAVDAAPMDYG